MNSIRLSTGPGDSFALYVRCLHGKRRFPILFVVLLILWLTTATQSLAQVTRSFTEPVEFSNVAAAEPGVLSRVLVREGERVTVGQPLAELDNQVLQQTLRIAVLHAESDAKVRSAEANLRVFKQKFGKLQPLLARGHANNAEVEKAQAEFEAAKAEFEIAKQESEEDRLEVLRIQAQINQRTISSPVDGLVTEIHHRPGEYISGNNPQVATVVKLDQLRVRFYLHSNDIQQIRVNQSVAVLLGDSKQKIMANVEFVSPVTDPESGKTRVDLLIDNADLRYRSGIVCHWISRTAEPASEHAIGSN